MQNEELRRSHLELEEAHLRQVELYDFAPVGYLTVDEAGLIREANLETAALLDVDRSELSGRPFSSFVDPSRGDGWRLVLAEARRSARPLSCDLVLLRSDGTTFDGHLICQHRAPRHADPALRLILSDVTERKRAEERIQTYVDRSPAALFVVDGRGRYVECNPAALELMGTDVETLRSMTVADVVEESDRPAALEEFVTLTSTGRLEHDYKLVRRDGRRIWVTLRAVKLADDRYMAFCQDITPRRAALEALRESEHRFRAIFDGATDGIVTADPANAQLLSCNAAFTALTGYTEEEVRHLRFEDMHEPADREQVVEAFAAMAEGRTNFVPGIPIRRKDGSVFAADISSARVVMPDRTYLAGFFRDVTERKLAIDALRESEQRFRALVEGAADAFFIHDFQGRFREVNRRACETLGYTREELLRMSVSDVDVNFDVPAGQREWVRIEPGKPHSLSSKQRRKDGTVFPVDITFACIDRQGERLYMGIVRDVTERTQAENDRAAAAAMLHRTGELARVGGWELDLATRFMRFSPEALLINEVGPGESISLEQALERIDPGYRPSFQAALRAAIEEGTPFDLEVPIVTSKGRRIWSRTQGTVVREEGGVVKLIGAFQDVTERRTAEESLRESEALLRAVTDATPDPIFAKDQEGRWTFANMAALHFTGKPLEEVLGRTDGEILGDPLLAAALSHHDREVLESRVPRTFEENFPGPTGLRTFLSTKAPLLDSDGRIVGIAGVAKDITEIRKLEGQIAVTARLAAIGTLVAGVAHEINNPLSGVIAGGEIAMELAQDARRRAMEGAAVDRDQLARLLDETVDSLKDTLDGGQRIAQIVKDLSLFARPHPQRARVRVIEIVDQTMRWLPVSLGRAVTLRVEDLGAPDVMASFGQIGQVLVNLVTNAAKATPRNGKGEVVVRLGPGDPGMARIEVIDNGVGMAPDVVERIFDPFFTTRPAGEGTGLGLPICHAIVTAHGGTIAVESEVGRGATFRVELPAAPPPSHGDAWLTRARQR